MSIVAGNDILAADFISTSAGSGDGGKVPKLATADGKMDRTFIRSAFGGTGADGALTITSGTTTIDLSSSNLVIKNYTSISITGTTAKLAFSNPHANGSRIILRSQGAVTLTSTNSPLIDITALGAAAGTVGYAGTYYSNSTGAGGGAFLASGGVTAALGGRISLDPGSNSPDLIGHKYPFIHMATMGGVGGANANTGDTATGGTAGRGAGSLIIECGGALNFTGTINAQGQNGGNGSGTHGTGSYAAGGGGGGGGGFVGIFYNTLTANSGTINISAGSGGSGALSSTGNANAQGGAGGGGKVAGSDAGAFTTNSGNRADGGNAGGAGYSIVAQNSEFV